MSMEELPLTINGVQGCSAVFRYTEVFPPLAMVRRPIKKIVREGNYHLVLQKNPSQVPLYLMPLEATIQLSTSGKWPENLEAVRKTKAAFYLQIAEALRNKLKIRAQGASEHLDIFKVSY